MRNKTLSEDKRTQLKEAIDAAGGNNAFADEHGINRGLVSMAYNGKFVSPQMIEALGWKRIYPRYFKCRLNDPAQVGRQIEKYLPGYKLVKDG